MPYNGYILATRSRNLRYSSTSITVSRFDKFKTEAADRKQLGCQKIPGLFLLKLKTGAAWRLRYSDLDGKRVTDTIASGEVKPEQAALIALDIRAQLQKGISPRTEAETRKRVLYDSQKGADKREYLNIGRYFEEIYSPYQITHRRTGKFILNGIRNHYGHLFDKDMDTLTGADIKAWFYDKQEKGLSRVTITREFRAFKAMLNHAARPADDSKPVLAINPLSGVRLPEKTLADRETEDASEKVAEKKRNIIPESVKEQIRKGLDLFADYIQTQRRNSREHGKAHLTDLDDVDYPHWFIPFTHIAWLTGMRPGDIRNMRWENILHNRFNGQTLLNFTPSKTKDKGESPAKVQFPVHGELQDLLNKWRNQNGNPQSGHVFPSNNPRGSGIIDKKAYRRHWIRVKKMGGAPDDLDFYCFRHNFISQLVLQGAPVLAIARLVGHKDGTMISRNYFHLGNQDAADIVAKFSQQVSTPAPGAREVRI